MKKTPTKCDLHVEMVLVSKLVPYAKNSKLHNDRQIADIARSIETYGFCNPCLIGHDNDLVAGHGRVMAAKKLGLLVVPCIRLSHLTAEQRRQYVIADNRLAEIGGGWDAEMLEKELSEIAAEGVTADVMGFSEVELADILEAAAEPRIKPLTVKPTPRMAWVLIGIPVIRMGEIDDDIRRITELEDVIVEHTVTDE